MLVPIETHQTQALAEAARAAYVSAQQVIDSVWEKLFGEKVEPPAEDIYVIDDRDGQFTVVFQDPSL